MTVLLKVGGASTGGVAEAVAALVAAGANVCVVHGAGPQISEEMLRRGLEPEFVHQQVPRKVDSFFLEIIAERKIAEHFEKRVVTRGIADVFQVVVLAAGALAARIAVWDDRFIIPPDRLADILGWLVGRPVPSAPEAVLDALAAGSVPVVSPLARGPLNVNADEMASALAVGIGATRISFLTDVPGVYRDGELVRSIDAARAETLVGRGVFDGGIVPKLLAAAIAARNGIEADIGATAVVA